MIELGSKEFWERISGDPRRLAAEVCSIDVVNLGETLHRHPALRAWVNAAFEQARIQEARAEKKDRDARARALLKYKKEVDPDTEKAKIVAVLNAEVELDADVQLTTEELFSAQEKRGALNAMSKALDDRKDMLVQLSANHRQETRDYT